MKEYVIKKNIDQIDDINVKNLYSRKSILGKA